MESHPLDSHGNPIHWGCLRAGEDEVQIDGIPVRIARRTYSRFGCEATQHIEDGVPWITIYHVVERYTSVLDANTGYYLGDGGQGRAKRTEIISTPRPILGAIYDYITRGMPWRVQAADEFAELGVDGDEYISTTDEDRVRRILQRIVDGECVCGTRHIRRTPSQMIDQMLETRPECARVQDLAGPREKRMPHEIIHSIGQANSIEEARRLARELLDCE